MFRKLVTVLCLLSVGAAVALTGGNPRRFSADKVVAVVGNSAILYSDLKERGKAITESRREQGYTSDRDIMNEALESLLLQKLLYSQALIDSIGKHSAEEIARSVDMRMEQLINEAGSISALEQSEGRPVFDIRADMRYRVEESALAEMMQSEVMSKVVVTPGEVERFFRSLDKNSVPIIPEQYVYAQISKFPTNTKGAKQRTRERMLEMRERIINGTRFDLLARMYSQDPGTARRGGEMDFSPLEGFVKPFADALGKLQPGQISEIVETEYGFHIIQLIEKKNNLYRMRHILLTPSFTDEELHESDMFLDSLAVQIRAGAITFEEAALQYSDDKYSKQNGGVVTNHELMELRGVNSTSYSKTKFFREELTEDYPVIRSLKTGDVSGSFRSRDLHGNVLSKVIKLLEVIPSHPANLNDDYLDIENMALADKQNKEFEKWLDQKIEGMYIRIDPEFRDGEFINKNWVK